MDGEKYLKEAVGMRLKETRIQLGLTQRDVAAMLGVAQPVYQRFKKGVYECNYGQICELCKIFDISADYLLGLKEY